MDWIYTLPNWQLFLFCTGTNRAFAALGLLASRKWVRRHADYYGMALGLVVAGVWTNFQTLFGEVDGEEGITAAI